MLDGRALRTDAGAWPVDAPGAGRVLVVDGRWGESRVCTEHSFGTLTVALPPMGAERVARVGAADSADYREGGMTLVFFSHRVAGTVESVREEADHAVLRVSLEALDPEVDTESRGRVALRGEVRARRVRSMAECFHPEARAQNVVPTE